MAITLPYTIAVGDTQNQDKIQANFDALKNGFNNPVPIQGFADASAPNSTLYYSTTASKLVWKDSGGVVRALY